MKDEHKTSRQALRSFQRDGIPMAVLKDETWSAVLPKTAQAGLVEPSTMDTTDTSFHDQENLEFSAQISVSGVADSN
jgi:hypothetical protein